MRKHLIFAVACAVVAVGCGENTEAVSNPGAAQKNQRGGIVTVGDRTWKIVPSVQCSVYPGDVVAVAGHAESAPDLEIVIDNDPNGRSGVRVGGEGQAVSWYSVPDTLQMTIDGKQVQGSATFSVYLGGAGETAQGTFKVDCL